MKKPPEQFVDVVKIVIRPDAWRKHSAPQMEAKIESAASRAVIKAFGFTDAAYRVDVYSGSTDDPTKRRLHCQRIIQKGKLREIEQ